jgi:hypothetical protein
VTKEGLLALAPWGVLQAKVGIAWPFGGVSTTYLITMALWVWGINSLLVLDTWLEK